MEHRLPNGAVSRESAIKCDSERRSDVVEVGEDVGEVSARFCDSMRTFFNMCRVVLNRAVAPSSSARRMAIAAD